MQTDAYDPDELSLWVADESARDDSDPEPSSAPELEDTAAIELDEPVVSSASARSTWHADDLSTSPVDLPVSGDTREPYTHESDAAEAERASEAALRRWLSE